MGWCGLELYQVHFSQRRLSGFSGEQFTLGGVPFFLYVFGLAMPLGFSRISGVNILGPWMSCSEAVVLSLPAPAGGLLVPQVAGDQRLPF